MQDSRLRELYEGYGSHVFRRCRWLLGDEDEAWDATQEVFLRAERGLDGFAGRSGLLCWLLRIATNYCLNQLRSRRVRQGRGVIDAAVLELEAPGSSGDAAESERALLVRSLLADFDPQTQALAVHYFVDEMSQEEVAELVGLSVPTVRKRLRRFVERARRLLGGASRPVMPAVAATRGEP